MTDRVYIICKCRHPGRIYDEVMSLFDGAVTTDLRHSVIDRALKLETPYFYFSFIPSGSRPELNIGIQSHPLDGDIEIKLSQLRQALNG